MSEAHDDRGEKPRERLKFINIFDAPAPPPVEWLWAGRVPLGCVTMLGGPGGVGKSVFVAGLEVAVAAGKAFLGSRVLPGEVIHVDFDTDLRLQYPWYKRAASGMGVPAETTRLIRYAHPEGGFGSLTLGRLEQLRDEVAASGTRLVVIDAFTSAFPYIRSNDQNEVAQVMALLRAIAEIGAAVLVLDHIPKPMVNDPGGRGLIGSTIKSAGSRAVHLLSRVPPKEVGGKDVLRLDTHKNNLAPIGVPLGIERVWAGNDVRFEAFDLADEDSASSAFARAKRAILEVVDEQPGIVVSREELLAAVVERANVSERTFKRAIAQAVQGGEVESIQMKARGNPVGFKSVIPPVSPVQGELWPEKENPVSDGRDFGPRRGLKSTPGPKTAPVTRMDLNGFQRDDE